MADPLLFNVARDPGERFNLASNHTDIVVEMEQAVTEHRTTTKPVKIQLADPPAAAQRKAAAKCGGHG